MSEERDGDNGDEAVELKPQGGGRKIGKLKKTESTFFGRNSMTVEDTKV